MHCRLDVPPRCIAVLSWAFSELFHPPPTLVALLISAGAASTHGMSAKEACMFGLAVTQWTAEIASSGVLLSELESKSLWPALSASGLVAINAISLRVLDEPAGSLAPLNVSNLFWILGRSLADTTACNGLFHRLCDELLGLRLEQLDAQQLTMCAWSLVRRGQGDKPTRALVAAFSEVLRRDLATFAPQSLSLLCWALSFPQPRLVVPSSVIAALVVHVTAGVVASIASFEPAQLSMCALAFGRASSRVPPGCARELNLALDAVTQQCTASLPSFNANQLTLLLCGLTIAKPSRGAADESLLKATLAAVQLAMPESCLLEQAQRWGWAEMETS